MDLSLERGVGRPALRTLYDGILALRARLRLGGARLQLRDSLSAASRPEERRLARELVARSLALSPEERRRAPALLNGAGLLAMAAGDFAAARRLFETAAPLSPRREDQALLQHNGYRAALELGDFPAALQAILAAAALLPEEFSPFPLRDYQPERILGADGTGVAFLCRPRSGAGQVVVKALFAEELARSAVALFSEAGALRQLALAHPAIVAPREGGSAGRGQPYLVTEHFAGTSLGEVVRAEGPLPAAVVRQLLSQGAAALSAAHRAGLLHRDLRPGNVLLQREGDALTVRLLDFGLTLRGSSDGVVLPEEVLEGTILGRSLAESRAYGAPSVSRGASGAQGGDGRDDVCALGRCAWLALYGTAPPEALDPAGQRGPLPELLRTCLAAQRGERPDAAALLAATAALKEALPEAPPDEAPPPPRGEEKAERATPTTTTTAEAPRGSLVERIRHGESQAAQLSALRAEAERCLAGLDFAGVEAALRDLLALHPEDEEARAALLHLQRRLPEGSAGRRGAAPPGQRPSEEELLSMLRRFQPQEDLFVAPAIPPRKLSTARATCQVPEEEHVLGLVDCTIFGDASDVVLFTSAGLRHRNMVQAEQGPHFLRYQDLPPQPAPREGEVGQIVDLGERPPCDVSGSAMAPARLAALLVAVRALYLDEHPGAGSA